MRARARKNAVQTCQITFRVNRYWLTYQDFLAYSARMEAELKSLEDKINQFVELTQRLRADNQQLRQQLASALNANKQLDEKISGATARLEILLNQIPEDAA
jgi:cell division protein ZapB